MRFIPFLILAITFTHALAQDAASEENWGWGGEEFPKESFRTVANNTPRVPLFDEAIGEHLLNKDFKFLANADSVKNAGEKSKIAYQYVHQYQWNAERIEFFKNVFAYLNSDAWEQDLETLPEGDAAFIRVVVYDAFFDSVDRRYAQIQLSKITDEKQLTYLKKIYHIKTEAEELHNGRLLLGIGIGANFFSNGADDIIKNAPSVDMNIGYCIYGRYCIDFHIGGIFQYGLKEDVVQDGYTYSKKDISYTTVEALFKVNVFTSYDYDLAVFGGLRLHALEIDSKTDEKYKEKYGHTMDDFYSYGYTTGITANKYFGGANTAAAKIFGLGARIGVATFGDTDLNITGYNWYATLNVLLRVGTSEM